MLKIAVVSIFPDMFNAIAGFGITSRAIKQGLVELKTITPRDFAHDRHSTVDDRPFGGGPGMVMMVQPLRDAIAAAKTWAGNDAKVIYLSPQGRTLNQCGVVELAASGNLVLVAGRYEGIDERLIQTVIDEEWSIGDYVLSGGELAAAVVVDAIGRLLPGVLNDETSALTDSFQDNLLAPPVYTRPADFKGWKVPDILLQGDPKKVEDWRQEQSFIRTQTRRPDLLDEE